MSLSWYQDRRSRKVCVDCEIPCNGVRCDPCRVIKREYDAIRYQDRKADKTCVDCGKPAGRFVTCRDCRKIRNDRYKKRNEDFPSIRALNNQAQRVWANKRREVLAVCASHGNDLPCRECADYRREYYLTKERPVAKRKPCGKCGSICHGTASSLCPRRFSVDSADYATSQSRDFLPPKDSL
jgi:hypothetical protein